MKTFLITYFDGTTEDVVASQFDTIDGGRGIRFYDGMYQIVYQVSSYKSVKLTSHTPMNTPTTQPYMPTVPDIWSPVTAYPATNNTISSGATGNGSAYENMF